MRVQKDYLGIVPARGGSKSIPKKNLIPLAGKPLLQYTFEEASKSKNLDWIIFTSDSLEMIELSLKFPKIKAPFVRPPELAGDSSTQVDVVLHSLSWLENNYSLFFNNILLLQPTSPFRTSEDIDCAIKEHKIKGSNRCLVGVSDVLQHPCEMISEEHPIKYAVEPKREGRQFFPTYKFINGAIYITPVSFFIKEKRFYPKYDFDLFHMSQKSGIDIDDFFQLKIAEGIASYDEN